MVPGEIKCPHARSSSAQCAQCALLERDSAQCEQCALLERAYGHLRMTDEDQRVALGHVD